MYCVRKPWFAVRCAITAAMSMTLLTAHAYGETAFRAVPVKCDKAMSARQKFEKAKWTVEHGWSDPSDIQNMYICVGEAAADDFVPAETLYGRLTSHRVPTLGIRAGTLIFGDLEDALYWFRKAADAGDGEAAIYAGEMYESGSGGTQSDEQAMALYRKAQALHNPLAQMHIDRLQRRPERVAAFEAKTLARAEAGHPDAMKEMAIAYQVGDPYVPDPAAAFGWMLKAAKAGDSDAMLDVAARYAGGNGTERDDNAAVDWLIKAWNAGRRSAAGSINVLYYTGRLDEAHKKALEALSATRHPENAARPASAPVPGQEPKSDRSTLELRASSGDPDAIFDLAEALLSGDGGPPDPVRARDLFLRIGDQVPEAAMNLGDIYYTGKLGKPDFVQAAKWYVVAAAMGDATGAKNAALIYRDGAEGVTPDLVEAYSLALLMTVDETGFRAGLRSKLTPEQRLMAVVRASRVSLSHYPQ